MLRSPPHGWASPYRPGDGTWWLQCATAMSQNQDQHCHAAPPNAGNSSQSLSLVDRQHLLKITGNHMEPWSKDNKPWFSATFPVNAVNRWRRAWRESSRFVNRIHQGALQSNPHQFTVGWWSLEETYLREIVTKQASGPSVLIWNRQDIDKLKRNTLPEWKQYKTYVLWLVPILIKPSASGSFGAPKHKRPASHLPFFNRMESPCLWRAWWVRLVWFGSCGASTDAETRCLASHGKDLQSVYGVHARFLTKTERQKNNPNRYSINFCALIRNTSHLIFEWMWGQEWGSNWQWAPSFVYFTGTAAPPGSSVCAEIWWNGNLRAPISGQSSGGFSMIENHLGIPMYIQFIYIYQPPKGII